ncbi:MAG: hypothetical protein RIC35_09080 [Marinoscillum sp.]
MKSILFLTALLLGSTTTLAQTPIDILQASNTQYLAKMEAEGFEFRSQIITEFNLDHAEQNVNIRLKAGYTYQLVAMGDSGIKALNLEVNSLKKFKLSNLGYGEEVGSGKIRSLVPEKSGKFKITLSVKDFGESDKGFVSFMVLRK